MGELVLVVVLEVDLVEAAEQDQVHSQLLKPTLYQLVLLEVELVVVLVVELVVVLLEGSAEPVEPVELVELVELVVLKDGSTPCSRAEVVSTANSKYMCLANQRSKSSREDLRKTVNYFYIKSNKIKF